MNETDLDRVFSALADPTRRGLMARLALGEANVKELTEGRDISQPAISKHLRVLESAGLVRREKRGRESVITADPRPMEEANSWIAHYARFWRTQFDLVEQTLADRAAAKQEGSS